MDHVINARLDIQASIYPFETDVVPRGNAHAERTALAAYAAPNDCRMPSRVARASGAWTKKPSSFSQA